MRLHLIAALMFPMSAFAQETTAPTPAEPMAQACPTGLVFDASLGACRVADTATSPAQSLPSGSGCGHETAREVTS